MSKTLQAVLASVAAALLLMVIKHELDMWQRLMTLEMNVKFMHGDITKYRAVEKGPE